MREVGNNVARPRRSVHEKYVTEGCRSPTKYCQRLTKARHKRYVFKRTKQDKEGAALSDGSLQRSKRPRQNASPTKYYRCLATPSQAVCF